MREKGAAYLFCALRPCTPALESQPGLELNHASCQRRAGLTERSTVERCAAIALSKRSQIQLVKEVEEIDTQIQLCILVFEPRHRRGLDKAHVKRLIPGSPKRVAMNEGRTDGAGIKVGLARAFRRHRIVALRSDGLPGLSWIWNLISWVNDPGEVPAWAFKDVGGVVT